MSIARRPPSRQNPIASGFCFPGGAQYETLNGIARGIKELGLEEGKQLTLLINDTKGDAAVTEKAAKAFEKDNVSLIYALTSYSHYQGEIRHD